jgi:hypothetical protein
MEARISRGGGISKGFLKSRARIRRRLSKFYSKGKLDREMVARETKVMVRLHVEYCEKPLRHGETLVERVE